MAQYSEFLIGMLSGFLILILGIMTAQLVSNILRRFLKGIEINKTLEEQLKLKVSIEGYISIIVKYIIYLITIIIVLNNLGVSTKILQIILVVSVIITAGFIVLAFKDWLPNLISGFYILRTKKIKRNDIIKTKDIKGKVISINLLETKIKTNNNEIIFIPNSNLTDFSMIKTRKTKKKC